MFRYQWKTISHNPGRHQLFDPITKQPIVDIEGTPDGWKWIRKTNYLLHRAHPANGIESTLIKAKIAAVRDLPDEA